jgi:hypothetical protein
VKRIFSVLFALAVVVTTTSTVYAQCSNATLTGNYAFNHHGFSARHGTPGNEVPFASVGVVTFDGAGNLSSTTTFVFNGSGGPFGPDTGTYTVNSDCTGTATDETAGIHFNIVTVGGGAEVFGIQTDTGATTTIDAKKQ